jgi:hypothetical protein
VPYTKKAVPAAFGWKDPVRGLHALALLQRYALHALRGALRLDPLVQEAVQLLMPWQPSDVVTGDGMDGTPSTSPSSS